MKDKAKGMVMGSFAGDSLALGVHWIYDTTAIDKTFGRVEHYLKPLKQSYHPTKELGEFTHYGDQTLVLLESLSSSGGFSLTDFARKWQALFDRYTGYFDEATKMTLQNFGSGKGPADSGSRSTDLGGAARIAPLVFACRKDLETLVTSARAQTAMTHNTPQVLDGAEFLARVAHRVLQGHAPVDSMKQVVAESFASTPLAALVEEGMEASGEESRRAILEFGQSCEFDAALPSAVQLITRYENDLREALIQNVMAGGDSAARGLVVGMVLGAHVGMEGIPRPWIEDLRQAGRILELLDKLDEK